mmetsp:Transcript_39631/g.123446  ORF Transcript_39631/g.123446 Transcript_39631/m.123446 type:complete len:244 (-) Transcript_39631:232-963(-)
MWRPRSCGTSPRAGSRALRLTCVATLLLPGPAGIFLWLPIGLPCRRRPSLLVTAWTPSTARGSPQSFSSSTLSTADVASMMGAHGPRHGRRMTRGSRPLNPVPLWPASPSSMMTLVTALPAVRQSTCATKMRSCGAWSSTRPLSCAVSSMQTWHGYRLNSLHRRPPAPLKVTRVHTNPVISALRAVTSRVCCTSLTAGGCEPTCVFAGELSCPLTTACTGAVAWGRQGGSGTRGVSWSGRARA